MLQPLPTKLNLRRKRARELRSGDEIEHFPIPSRITVRRRSTAAAIELKEPEVCMFNFFSFLKVLFLNIWRTISMC